MRLRATIALFALAVGANLAIGRAQYEAPKPLPATTSLPELRRQAIGRAATERFHVGLDALAKRDWAGARAEFNAIVAMDPPEPEGSSAWYDLALAQANLGENAAAAQSLHRAIARDSGFLAAMANLIAIDLALGDLKDARATADRFVAAAPDSARALYSRGLVALQTNDFSTARADFSKLLRGDPQYAVAHYDLGLAEVKTGNYADAQREFTAAVQIAPSYARARFALGTILLRSGDRSDARAAFDRAARDASDDTALRELAIQLRDAIGAPH
jgi:tetratricopeptide (TPR) repeat protein